MNQSYAAAIQSPESAMTVLGPLVQLSGKVEKLSRVCAAQCTMGQYWTLARAGQSTLYST